MGDSTALPRQLRRGDFSIRREGVWPLGALLLALVEVCFSANTLDSDCTQQAIRKSTGPPALTGA